MNRAQRRAIERAGVPDLGAFMDSKSETTVLVGFCHPHDRTFPMFQRCLRRLLAYEWLGRPQQGKPIRLIDEIDHEASGVHVPDARNAIVEGFLSHPAQPQWLLMVDDDATFRPDLLDQFFEYADPIAHPIVGALAFGVAPIKTPDGLEIFNEVGATIWELFPTIYVFDEDGHAGMWFDYTKDSLVDAHSTGCHCFVVHRSVLEDPRWREDGHPLPFFRVAVAGGKIISEDQFFFVKAGALGYDVAIDTSIKTGHIKNYVADESMFDRQRFEREMYAAILEESEGGDDAQAS